MRRIVAASWGAVDFAPATVSEEVVQNVRTILSTAAGTVPLDRDFGVDADALDLPAPSAQAKIAADVVDKIARYEPRARVVRVAWQGDADGRLRPRVEVEIDEQ
ncbi:GPW/gp25 family protein [Pyramidobacter piscolens]|uniref:GPW/gp25 family protein n=1 Tax=Pyramidobacter piscolens TaxID=638849 RepID=UPI00266C50AF|nr:GPW/gp25 family protein [Pyramidobacter piscolens]